MLIDMLLPHTCPLCSAKVRNRWKTRYAEPRQWCCKKCFKRIKEERWQGKIRSMQARVTKETGGWFGGWRALGPEYNVT